MTEPARSRRRAPFAPTFFETDPLFWPIAPAAQAFSEYTEWPPVADYGSRLAHRAGVSFREQAPKPRGRRKRESGPRELYDARIVEDGWVPTRPASWHDFLNMLVWAAFPEAKRQLHARQHRAISARLADGGRALPGARTREQDALALLDEGGVVLACRPAAMTALEAALRARRADEARALLSGGGPARAVIFGHAIYEGLVLGRADGWGAGIAVAHEGDLDDGPSLVRAADAALAALLATEGTLPSPEPLVRVDLAIIRPR